jgi:FixJ family two-component response regulator
MRDAGFTVFIVDDEPRVLRALSRLVTAVGYQSRTFSSAHEFLAGHDPFVPGCAVLDVAMPDVDGLRLQTMLSAGRIDRPIIFITGRGDITTSVRAMKAGAIDFLTKPVHDEDLIAAIERAREVEAKALQARSEIASILTRLCTLTPRERQVLPHVVAGWLNKQIAGKLGTSEKTIKVHRARMMRKLRIRTVQDLVRLAERAGIEPIEAR